MKKINEEVNNVINIRCKKVKEIIFEIMWFNYE